ncbi:histidine kinase [Amycolatopsis sp. NPDC059657]|uniref:sensor histidine kinase n=1 Tax=Amycolatopsis sp. NPDC059657 TaxID=3346899 RepID=UPI00366C6ADA
MFNSGGGWRRDSVAIMLLSVAFLAIAAAGIAWRAAAPSDGTKINVGDAVTSSEGVTVQTIVADTPLQVGDRIVAIDGRKPEDALKDGIGGDSVRVGQVLRYDIVRDGRAQSVDVTLREYPVLASVLRGWPSLLVNIVLLGTALVIFLVRPRDRAAQAAILPSSIGAATLAWSGYFQLQALDLVAGSQFWRWWGGQLTFALVWGGIMHFAIAFPEASAYRNYRRAVFAGYAGSIALYPLVAAFALITLDNPLTKLAVAGSPALPTVAVYPALIVVTLVIKYIRTRDPLTRRRMRWAATAVAGGAIVYLLVWILPAAIFGSPPFPIQYQTLTFLPIPLAVTVAILRHKALNIDVVLSRSLVYGTLSVGLVGLYVGVVTLLSQAFPPMDRLWQQAIAAAAIAIAVQPLRAWLQSIINRRLFGERTDPYHVVSSLAKRLEGVHAPAQQLEAMVETIGTQLRLSYVAIELDRTRGSEKAASYGEPTTESHRLPLTYQGELVGQLVIARRGTLGRKERSVLAEVALHAGTVVHTARLTADLTRSRDRLVQAREEERRRLLRELHDGVGPTLAAVTLGLHAGRRSLPSGTAAEPLLERLQQTLSGAITEIRRLAHDLRPPALDSLGLLGAVEEYIGSVDGHGMAITLDTPPELPPMPPAVDVAAYRIICESLTNVTRHARANNCTVRIQAGSELLLEVIDDGVGIRERGGGGIGLGSMRERATELGGEFKAEKMTSGGTRIRATLPLPGDSK